MKKIWILLTAALMTGCLLSPDKPRVHNTDMTVECSEVPESVDSIGVATFPCFAHPDSTVNPMPPGPTK